MVYTKVSSNDSKCKDIKCGRSLIINPNIIEKGSPDTIEDKDVDKLMNSFNKYNYKGIITQCGIDLSNKFTIQYYRFYDGEEHWINHYPIYINYNPTDEHYNTFYKQITKYDCSKMKNSCLNDRFNCYWDDSVGFGLCKNIKIKGIEKSRKRGCEGVPTIQHSASSASSLPLTPIPEEKMKKSLLKPFIGSKKYGKRKSKSKSKSRKYGKRRSKSRKYGKRKSKSKSRKYGKRKSKSRKYGKRKSKSKSKKYEKVK